MATVGRIPVIALDYSEAQLAVPKELMIDYENGGNIYVVSADGTQIFDITSKVRELIESGEIGSNMVINIEGVGTTHLASYIAYLTDNYAEVVGGSCVHSTIPRAQTDLNSIQLKKNILQVAGFDGASNNTIPVKQNGEISWIDADVVASGTLVDPVINNAGDVITNNPSDNILVLTADTYQKTSYSTVDGFMVVLPDETVYDYTKITWCYISQPADINGEIPSVTFNSNIIWQSDEASKIEPDCVHIFEFETWDGGNMWFGKVTVYGRPLADNIVTIDYLDANVYDKETINDFLSWSTKKL